MDMIVTKLHYYRQVSDILSSYFTTGPVAYIIRLIFFGPFFRDKLSLLHFFIYSFVSLKTGFASCRVVFKQNINYSQ